MNDTEISSEEKGVISTMRLNKISKKIEIRKKFTVGRLEIEFRWRSKKNLMGRFGGGWNWALGFKGLGRTTIIFLLICSIRFHLKNRTKQDD
ncbi:unnamed protein product [marine sediment metagenome]|uniref:Uncharacterized protein n=1 Tax=marine sediment metagenome TaxID=412755 RepID=X0ZKW9_9ZZZZ